MEFINGSPWWFFLVMPLFVLSLGVVWWLVIRQPRQPHYDMPRSHPPHVDDDDEPRARRQR